MIIDAALEETLMLQMIIPVAWKNMPFNGR